MDKDSLREHLEALKTQIADAGRTHPGSMAGAHDSVSEIERLIEDSKGAPHPSLPDLAESLAVRFEADHPTLAAGARRLVDLLGEVGI
ncbi:MAG TPA: DUF4404 family protein [Steroidobacteraceae bacterium]|jgi:hypothetical protein|nr:DUF4404 family protein [Steroidobacteraceae bacterium]